MFQLFLGAAFATTFTVGPTSEWPTIMSAVAASTDGDTIEVEPGTWSEAVDFAGRSLVLTSRDGPDDTVLAPPAGSDAVTLGNGESGSLSGFTIAPVGGRGIVVSGSSLSVEDVVVQGAGSVGVRGGSIFLEGGTVDLVDVTLSGGAATYGGQVYASAGTFSAIGLTVEGGSATAGGAFYAENAAELVLTSAVVRGPVAVTEGGFAWLDGASLTAVDLVVDAPSASSGAGVYVVGFGAVDIESGEILDAEATGEGGAIYAAEGSRVTLASVAFSGGGASDGAGLSLGDGVQCDLVDVTLERNIATGTAGAIRAVDSATIVSVGLLVSENAAADGAGASAGTGVSWTDSSSTWQDNVASGDGGALALEGSATASFASSVFLSNAARSSGGAVSHSGTGTLVFEDATLSYNEAQTGDGGAVSTSGAIEFLGGSVEGNTSTRGSGGGLFASGTVDVDDVRFTDNTADDDGGALFLAGGATVSLREVIAFRNAAGGAGGALVADGVGALSLARAYFHGNAATEGGAIWVDATTSAASFTNVRVTDNTADGDGGGLWSDGSVQVEVTNATFAGNSARTSGGHVYAAGPIALVNTLLAEAADGGGATGPTSGSDRFYNLVWDNAGGEWNVWSDVTGTSGNIDQDPRFVAYSADGDESDDDLSLGSGSPAIDAGSPAIFDVDGSRSDIGAFGGPDADVLDGDGDGYYDNVDCDDTDGNVHPDAVETAYDGIDQDCSGADLDDLDMDGFGAEALGGGDCDDDNPDVHPDAVDAWYDGVDADCGDDNDYDQDGDRHVYEPFGGDDCDDTDLTVHGGAVEIWYDGIDQDCDDRSDFDRDLDLHDSDRYAGDDCNDFDAASFPGNNEIPYDGIDQDCSGADLVDVDGDGWVAIEAGGTDCDDAIASVFPGAAEDPDDGFDTDCDGFYEWDLDGDTHVTDEQGGDDCDDSDAEIHPGVEEIWYDGVDQDCDGRDDDQDGDGWLLAVDCDDEDPGVHPEATEKWNARDDDCDGWAESDDRDRDGLMDITEWLIGSDYESSDTDGDSLEDGVEWNTDVSVDLDLDLVFDILDPDDDGDGLSTREELGFDLDGDGANETDVDGDGIHNAHDDDSDGDGYLDEAEGLEDEDRDGAPDFLDYQGDFTGGGCGGGQWALLVVGLGFLRRRTRLVWVAALALLSLAQRAHAVDAHGFQLYGTTGDPHEFTRLGYPEAGRKGEWDAGVLVDYADDPLAESFPWGREPVLDALATANLTGSYSFGGVRFDGVVPVHAIGVDSGGAFSSFGDMRLGALVPVLHPHGWRPAFALHGSVLFPTGAPLHYVSAGGFRFALAAQVAREFGSIGVLAMAGGVVSPAEEERNLSGGGGPIAGLGVAYRVSDALSATFELGTESDLGFANLPVEATLGARGRLPLGGWAVLGAAAGLTPGVGASRWRAFAGVGWSYRKPEVTVSLHFDVDANADRDGDGFPDVTDKCPDQAETVDGFEDDDGCPELDGDGDGVPFGADECPGEPIHPEQDPRYSDGCPKVAEFAGDKIVITQAVFFREGRAELLASSESVLAAVAEVMNAHPEIPFFLVAGHTNSNGSDVYNLRLSDARAYTVISWLGAHGVAPERLLSKGFGELMPLVADGEPDALVVNRRVEFRVVQVEDVPGDARTLDVPPEASVP